MNKLLVRLGTAATILATPAIAAAQRYNPVDIVNLENLLSPFRLPPGPLRLEEMVSVVLNFLVLVAAIIAIFYLIWAGIQYITASTDEEKAKKARTGIYNAIIGIVVIILAYAIIQVVSNLTRNTLQERGSTIDSTIFR